jgi:phosphate transport system protein
MVEDPGIITPGIHLLFCTKNLEQMGDHTKNIAEAVQYIIEGYALLNDRSRSADGDRLPLAVEC